MDISRCYSRYGCREECKSCEHSTYCQEAADPKLSSQFEYDDSRANSITEKDAKESIPDEPQYYLTPADVAQCLHSLGSIAMKSKTQFKIMMCWISKYGATHGRGRDGLIKGISEEIGVHQRTVQRHIQAIVDDPALSMVFKYDNRRVAGRNVDRGNAENFRSKCWVQPEFILK